MKQSLAVFLALFSLAGCAIEQPKFRANQEDFRAASAGGQIKEFFSAMEADATNAEKSNAWEDASDSYYWAGIAANNTGQLQKALTYLGKAFEMAEKARNPRRQAYSLLQLAVVHRQLGQDAKVRELLQKGLEITQQVPSYGAVKEQMEAAFYQQLGQDFLRQGEVEKAIEYLSYALQKREATLTLARRIPRDLVRDADGRAFPQFRERAQNDVIGALSSLGNAYRRAGKNDEAIKASERGLGMIRETGLKTPAEVNLYQGLGEAYESKKDYVRALETFHRALRMAEERHLAGQIQFANSHIGDILLQAEKPSDAIPYYRKAIDSVESTRSLLESEELRTSFFEEKGQIYGGIILAHLGAKNVEEAFNYNERARSRAFLDILGSKVQLARSGTLLEEERALQAKISSLHARLAAETEGVAPDRVQLRQELEAAQKAYADFLAKVRKENKEQASLMNVEPLTLKQVQQLLDPGVTVLEYFVPRGKAMLWVVEKDRVNLVRLTSDRNEIISNVTALRESINQVEEKNKFKQAAEELYRTLIEPALPYIQGKELLIIPHDVMHYIPFQALLSPQGKYLIQDYPVYYLSSASLMQFTRDKRRSTRERAFVMGNPDLGDPAYNLRFAEREAREVARTYPESAVYLRSEATKSKATSLSPAYDILHFAVHGELREDDPLNSGLLLAPDGKEDGRLRVGEIFSLNLKADTVVLSACESGLGKINRGDEIIGLTRAFIYAGTPSVITTLWKVNDRASYELMEGFYSNLRTMKKSQALRQAQLKTMQEFPHPFFWAAYELTGEP
jgi:CHAT domain-containing protein